MLAGDFRVVRRDLRGHGGSSDPGNAPSWSFDGLVKDLAAFCDALDLRNLHLLGESTGGMLAIGFAATQPERLRSLTLCGTPTTIVISKPVLARGFQPQRIFAERAAGVVTVFAYYGTSRASAVVL